MFIRKISTYVNAKNDERVLVTMQSVQVTKTSALFAMPLPEGAKVGSATLQNGISLAEAKAQLAIGQDMSEVFEFGAQAKDANKEPMDKVYEVQLKAV